MLGIYYNRRSLFKYRVHLMGALSSYSSKKRIHDPSELKGLFVFLTSRSASFLREVQLLQTATILYDDKLF